MTITRRTALAGGLAGLGACAGASQRFSSARPMPAAFPCGVASGDPRRDSVVLWTRAAPADGGRLSGTAELAEDEGFSRIVSRIPFETGPARDHTVKVVAEGLQPGRRYHYRFVTGGDVSPVGRTRTVPETAEAARFAVVSCSNYPFGHFNAYDHIARQGFDAVIHLGDYIYEYGPDGYGGETGARIGRPHDPPREILTLDDYRRRHRQYKADPGSAAMHAAHPLIAVWDDHETANNAWEGGAENHQPLSEGEWSARKSAALQAYYEYMPIRDPEPGRAREALFRDYPWGGLLSLAAIESRLQARDKQFEYSEVLPALTSPEAIAAWERDVLGSPDRALLGDAQLDVLDRVLTRSVERAEPWRLIANQVIMARVRAPDLASRLTEEDIVEFERQWSEARAFVQFTALGLPLNIDAWDGYPAARERFLQLSKRAGARDLVVLTGDTHEFWANTIETDAGEEMGVEIGTAGVTSPGPTSVFGDRAFDYSLLLRKENPSVRWHGTGQNGYVDLTLDGDRGAVDYVTVSTVLEPDYTVGRAAGFGIEKKGGTVRFTEPQALGLKERVLF